MKNLVMETDALYEKAVDVIRKTRRAPLTHLQRRLGIGYQAAARLIDMLEERGVIGPVSATSPREILLTLEVPQFFGQENGRVLVNKG